MPRSRNRTALAVSIVLHAVLAAVVLGTLRPSGVQLRIESIEVISDETAGASRPQPHSAPRTATQVHEEKNETLAASQTQEPAPAAPTVNNSGAASASAGTVSTSVMSKYLAGIRDQLSSALRVPKTGPSSYLRVLLKLTLLEDGAVQNPVIEQGSGSAEFDRSVLEALERAKPFPRFGAEMATVHQITLKLPIEVRPRR